MDGWMGGWMDGWVEVKALLRIAYSNRAVVAEWVNVQSIINPMLKVEGSNTGASILKFGLYQFSKWMHLDKNNNLGISVALLVLND